MDQNVQIQGRETVFISKATPEDDEFVLWLAPRLEAAGYKVFADVLNLQGGDRWRKVVTATLQNESVKMLLCCRDATLAKNGVQEEIGIAEDLVKELQDPRFIIPLRIERYKKVFGIGELQYINFLGSWANGLKDLLELLEKQGVPCSKDSCKINPDWEAYKRRLSIKVERSPETLTSNWLQIAKAPDRIFYYQPSGAIDHPRMEMKCREFQFPAKVYLRGFFSFASLPEIEKHFSDTGKFVVHSEHELTKFLEDGSKSPKIWSREAKNLVLTMFRESWESFCREKGLLEYAYSSQLGFHTSKDQVALGKRISWGAKELRRSSMLRNKAKGKVWEYGITAIPNFWPFPHFRLKARVVFSELSGNEVSSIIDDVRKQHRLRRSICSGWRNKAWHGRLMAYVELLSGGSDHIELPLSNTSSIHLSRQPMVATSPVTTDLPDVLADDAEELDSSTLGNFDLEVE